MHSNPCIIALSESDLSSIESAAALAACNPGIPHEIWDVLDGLLDKVAALETDAGGGRDWSNYNFNDDPIQRRGFGSYGDGGNYGDAIHGPTVPTTTCACGNSTDDTRHHVSPGSSRFYTCPSLTAIL